MKNERMLETPIALGDAPPDDVVFDDVDVDVSQKIIELQELVHDEQCRQLCAVHTLNNLLQLTKNVNSSIDPDSKSTHADTDSCIVIHGKVYNIDEEKKNALRTYATKVEFDMIADHLTHQEQLLLLDYNGTTNNMDVMEESKPKKISLWNTLRSNHRTPISGNYSFEVLQTALLNRNIELEWYTSKNCTKGTTSSSDDQKERLLVGYIVNEKQPLSIFTPHRLLFESRHWYAITSVRWAQMKKDESDHYHHDHHHHDHHLSDNIDVSKGSSHEEDTLNVVSKNTRWAMIDSEMKKIHEFDSETDLSNYIRKKLERQDCNIFQAWLQT